MKKNPTKNAATVDELASRYQAAKQAIVTTRATVEETHTELGKNDRQYGEHYDKLDLAYADAKVAQAEAELALCDAELDYRDALLEEEQAAGDGDAVTVAGIFADLTVAAAELAEIERSAEERRATMRASFAGATAAIDRIAARRKQSGHPAPRTLNPRVPGVLAVIAKGDHLLARNGRPDTFVAQLLGKTASEAVEKAFPTVDAKIAAMLEGRDSDVTRRSGPLHRISVAERARAESERQCHERAKKREEDAEHARQLRAQYEANERARERAALAKREEWAAKQKVWQAENDAARRTADALRSST